METAVATLTILFEDPFWIGLYERETQGTYAVCKITFGAEPKDGEVYAFLERNWRRLRFGPTMGGACLPVARVNPKRMQRLIGKKLESTGMATKAQQALKLQQEQGKLEKKTRSRAQREAEEARRFSLHRQKQKEKHKGH